MTEGRRPPTPEEEQRKQMIAATWQHLDTQTQEAACVLAVSSQRIGVGEHDLKHLTVPLDIANNLVDSGLAITRNRQDIATAFINQHKAEVMSILQRGQDDPGNYQLSDQERELLYEYDTEVSVSKKKNNEARYLLTEGVYDFILGLNTTLE